ncbi:MAG TPA: energy transducer TonB [Pyrinomonadaceae bacterium]|nr:energy transducer TonB [Pyrinomonadaceae bacterium]
MFNNLIESSSHKREFKRRGSFFLFTVVGYVLLFTAGGVASIFAYDAQLDQQVDEITITFVPPQAVIPNNPVPPRNAAPRSGDNPRNVVPSVPILYENPNNPRTPPAEVGTAPVKFPPAGPGTVVGPLNNPLGGGGSGPGEVGTGGSGTRPVEVITPPPPPVTVVVPKPPQIIRKNVINGEAIELPKPPYPQFAKTNRIQGTVAVQVLIDESGRVVSAHAMSGNGFLTTEAVKAAYRARFSPTKLGDQPVKVSGVITYNFVLN